MEFPFKKTCEGTDILLDWTLIWGFLLPPIKNKKVFTEDKKQCIVSTTGLYSILNYRREKISKQVFKQLFFF